MCNVNTIIKKNIIFCNFSEFKNKMYYLFVQRFVKRRIDDNKMLNLKRRHKRALVSL